MVVQQSPKLPYVGSIPTVHANLLLTLVIIDVIIGFNNENVHIMQLYKTRE